MQRNTKCQCLSNMGRRISTVKPYDHHTSTITHYEELLYGSSFSDPTPPQRPQSKNCNNRASI